MYLLYLLLLSSSLLPNISASVIDLSSYSVEEFRINIEDYDSIFVKFFAPYCGHCKSMAQDYVELAKRMQDKDPTVLIAEVDCTNGQGTKICKKFNVKGYPSLQLFKQGKPDKQYEGARTVKEMEDWLKTNAQLTSKRFSSYAELNTAIQNSGEVTVIAIFSDKEDPWSEQWFKAAKKVKDHWTYRDLEFYHVFDDNTKGKTAELKSIGLGGEKALRAPAIILHRPQWLKNKHEPTDIMYKLESKQDIAEWIISKAYGLVIYRTRDTEEELKPPLIVAYYDMDFKRHPKRTHLWRNRLMEMAKKYPEVTFAISSSQSFRKQLRRQTLEPPKDDEKPLIVGYDNFGLLYLMRDEFSMRSLEQFIVDYKNGDVSPHLRSQEPPQDNHERQVKIAVGGNFHKLVTNNPKDVFINFYAPWCKHSKELEPIWDELAMQLKNEPGVEIVKMDATANEVPSQFEVPQYPTVYFVPKHTKKPVMYNRGKLMHEFVQFLAVHSTDEMKGFKRDGAIKKEKVDSKSVSDRDLKRKKVEL